MPQWWDELMLWMDTSYIPLWVVLAVMGGYFLLKLLRETRTLLRPPPRDD